MADPVTDVIVATGGTAVVRAAYRSGNPALGVGPGNVPVLVDATADLARRGPRASSTARRSTTRCCARTSRSSSCEDASAGRAAPRARASAAVLLDDDGRDRLRATCFPDGRLNGDAIGKDAPLIASAGRASGCRRGPGVLLAPIDLVVPEEPFAREKLCPVLGVVSGADGRSAGIEAARAVRADRRGRDTRRPSTAQDPRDDHGLRRRGARAAGRGQRRQQHRQLGPRARTSRRR